MNNICKACEYEVGPFKLVGRDNFCVECCEMGLDRLHALTLSLTHANIEYEKKQPWHNKSWFKKALNTIFLE